MSTAVAGPSLTERLLAGRRAGAARGRHQSGTTPYGYRRDYSGRYSGEADGQKPVLVVEPAEAEVVRLIFLLYLRLRSFAKVIRELGRRGLRPRRAAAWSRAGLAWVLRNQTYLGRVHFGPINVMGRHERVVSPIVFWKAGKLMRTNNRRRAPIRIHPGVLTPKAPAL